MREGAEVSVDKERANHYFYEVQRYMDFLEWLFDTELHYTSQKEMFEKFERFEQEKETEELVLECVDDMGNDPL